MDIADSPLMENMEIAEAEGILVLQMQPLEGPGGIQVREEVVWMETKHIWGMKKGLLPGTGALKGQVDIQGLRVVYMDIQDEHLAERKQRVPLQRAFLQKELVGGLHELQGQ